MAITRIGVLGLRSPVGGTIVTVAALRAVISARRPVLLLAFSGNIDANLAVQDEATRGANGLLQRLDVFKFDVAVATRLATLLVKRDADRLDLSAAEKGSNVVFVDAERQVANKGSVRRVGGQVSDRAGGRAFFGVVTLTVLVTIAATTFVLTRRTTVTIATTTLASVFTITVATTTTTFVVARRTIASFAITVATTTVAERGLVSEPVEISIRQLTLRDHDHGNHRDHLCLRDHRSHHRSHHDDHHRSHEELLRHGRHNDHRDLHDHRNDHHREDRRSHREDRCHAREGQPLEKGQEWAI